MDKLDMLNNLSNAIEGVSTAFEHTKKMDAEKKAIRKFIVDAWKDYNDTKDMIIAIVNKNMNMLKKAMTWEQRSGYPYHGICYDRYFRFGGVEVVFGAVDGKGFDGHCGVDANHAGAEGHEKMFPKATGVRFVKEENYHTREECEFRRDILNNYNTNYPNLKGIIEDDGIIDTMSLDELLESRKYAENTQKRTKFLYEEVLGWMNKVAEKYRKQVTDGITLAGEKYVKVA